MIWQWGSGTYGPPYTVLQYAIGRAVFVTMNTVFLVQLAYVLTTINYVVYLSSNFRYRSALGTPSRPVTSKNVQYGVLLTAKLTATTNGDVVIVECRARVVIL